MDEGVSSPVVTGGPPPVVFPGPWVRTEPPCSLGRSCRPPAASKAAFRLGPTSQSSSPQGQERVFHTISGGTLGGICHHLPGGRRETDSWPRPGRNPQPRPWTGLRVQRHLDAGVWGRKLGAVSHGREPWLSGTPSWRVRLRPDVRCPCSFEQKLSGDQRAE